MNNRFLKALDRDISEIGLGTWQFGGDFGEVKEETALEILKLSVDRGINFIDTADVYGNGISERVIGKFLSSTDKKLTVATKFGRRSEVYPDSYTLDKLRSHVKDSIKNLGVKSLDLLQLHCIPKKVLEDGEIFNWLRLIKSEGLIKAFGVSVESMEEANISLKQEGLASIQIIFNIFRQSPITELFETAIKKGVGIIVRLPLSSGLLAGKFTKNTTFPESDHRNYNRDGKFFNVGETFSGLKFSKGLEFVEVVRKFVPQNISMAEFSLRWILDHPAVTTVIAGVSKPYQVESNCLASELEPLSAEIHKELYNIYLNDFEKEIRGPY